MTISPKQSTLSRLNLFTQIAAIGVAVVGASVQSGWLLDITFLKSALPGLATMKANTAFAFLLGGAALWILRPHKTSKPALLQWHPGRLLAALVAVIGGLTLAEYVSGVNLHIDQMLCRDDLLSLHTSHPGRMAPATALNFVFVGLALFILDSHSRTAQSLALLVLMLSTLAITGYAFGVSSLYAIKAYSSMAIHTSISFLLLSLGILFARPEKAFMKIVTSNTAGGIVSRRLLPVTPPFFFCLGLLRLAGEERGYYDARFGLALMVILSMVFSSFLTAWIARILYHVDMERQYTKDEIVALNAGLERTVAERTRELRESLAQVK